MSADLLWATLAQSLCGIVRIAAYTLRTCIHVLFCRPACVLNLRGIGLIAASVGFLILDRKQTPVKYVAILWQREKKTI